ncbi:hypothetical protein C5Q97_01455 [Victivallales bacterium CCUG 44730]|nr:hypothetical protein C5Q97_01455 [Victivallales bacterium CCUG 44730]
MHAFGTEAGLPQKKACYCSLCLRWRGRNIFRALRGRSEVNIFPGSPISHNFLDRLAPHRERLRRPRGGNNAGPIP